MLWRRSSQPALPPIAAAPVPSTESLRVAALRASWSRDRVVGRRRVVWRWTLWYGKRWGPHLLVIALVLLALAQWLWTPRTPALRPPIAGTSPGPTPIPRMAGNAGQDKDGAPARASAQQPADASRPLQLRMETEWAQNRANTATGARRPSEPVSQSTLAPPAADASTPEPTLKFETWLHSKEI